jgi:hypothetical protein
MESHVTFYCENEFALKEFIDWVCDEVDMNPILQNAIQIRETGEIIRSRDRHDFVSSSCGKYYVDGGQDYQRIGYEKMSGFESLTIYINDPLKDRINKALWGTYGKDGNQPFKWVFLKDCETDHLKAILETQVSAAGWIKQVIQEILNERS